MTLEQYITQVETHVLALSSGVIDLGCMVDYADGELSLTELHESGLTPRRAARVLLAHMTHGEMGDPNGDLEVMDYLMGVE